MRKSCAAKADSCAGSVKAPVTGCVAMLSASSMRGGPCSGPCFGSCSLRGALRARTGSCSLRRANQLRARRVASIEGPRYITRYRRLEFGTSPPAASNGAALGRSESG
eukprot:scaffold110936_cov66-Phaeocystis_antarctica.AAC.3